MSKTRRLSLRARMLVMLVGVTTLLLLVMGAVSTYLLARRVDGEIATINGKLVARADYLARYPASSSDGYAVVEIPLKPVPTVRQRTSGKISAQLASEVRTWLRASASAHLRALAAQGQLVKHDLIGCSKFPYVGCAPFDITSKIEVASTWASHAGTGGVAGSASVPGNGSNAGKGSIAGNGTATADGPAILIVGQQVSTDPGQVRGFIIAEVITGAALIVLLALGGEWLIGKGLEPLDEMARTANEITTRGDLAARMTDVNEQTEVGRLASSINTMLDRIQQAFNSRLRSEQKVREFAADASHELRTPLTTIRGYAELYGQGALGPDELPNAMRRIEQEAQRMSTLVAELLELARLDRTSSLDLAESDLASVVRDAVADAVAVEPERPVRAEAPPRLVAVVDEARIRQVLANLLGNVRAHTPVSTPVAVHLGQITGGVLIEVADAGPGMSAEDAIRAFDRFHRGQSGAPDAAPAITSAANSADAGGGSGKEYPHANGTGMWTGTDLSGGSGLGLSIVQAIANAHGGRATLESWPGRGTKVRVWLPVRIVP